MTQISAQTAKHRLMLLINTSSIPVIDTPNSRCSKRELHEAIIRSIEALDADILSQDDLK